MGEVGAELLVPDQELLVQNLRGTKET